MPAGVEPVENSMRFDDAGLTVSSSNEGFDEGLRRVSIEPISEMLEILNATSRQEVVKLTCVKDRFQMHHLFPIRLKHGGVSLR